MSILAVFVVGALASIVGLVVALAFARATLYANVLTELVGSRTSPSRARTGSVAPPVTEVAERVAELDDPRRRPTRRTVSV